MSFFLGGGQATRAPKDLDVWNEGSMLPDKMDNLISPTLKNPRGWRCMEDFFGHRYTTPTQTMHYNKENPSKITALRLVCYLFVWFLAGRLAAQYVTKQIWKDLAALGKTLLLKVRLRFLQVPHANLNLNDDSTWHSLKLRALRSPCSDFGDGSSSNHPFSGAKKTL